MHEIQAMLMKHSMTVSKRVVSKWLVSWIAAKNNMTTNVQMPRAREGIRPSVHEMATMMAERMQETTRARVWWVSKSVSLGAVRVDTSLCPLNFSSLNDNGGLSDGMMCNLCYF